MLKPLSSIIPAKSSTNNDIKKPEKRTLYQNHCYYRRLFVRGLNPGDTFPYGKLELDQELDLWLHEYQDEVEMILGTTPFLRESDKKILSGIAQDAASKRNGAAMQKALADISRVRDITHKMGSMPIEYTHSIQDTLVREVVKNA